jgi:hypothetical protein
MLIDYLNAIKTVKYRKPKNKNDIIKLGQKAARAIINGTNQHNHKEATAEKRIYDEGQKAQWGKQYTMPF